MSLIVEILSKDELTPEEQENYGSNDYNQYLKITHNGKVICLESDAYEPEDVRFYRDLGWIPTIIRKAYELGKEDCNA